MNVTKVLRERERGGNRADNKSRENKCDQKPRKNSQDSFH